MFTSQQFSLRNTEHNKYRPTTLAVSLHVPCMNTCMVSCIYIASATFLHCLVNQSASSAMNQISPVSHLETQNCLYNTEFTRVPTDFQTPNSLRFLCAVSFSLFKTYCQLLPKNHYTVASTSPYSHPRLFLYLSAHINSEDFQIPCVFPVYY